MRSRHQPRFDLHNKSRVLCFVLVVVLFWVRDLSWVSPAAGGAPLHRPESPGCSTPLSRSSTSFHTRKTRNTHTHTLAAPSAVGEPAADRCHTDIAAKPWLISALLQQRAAASRSDASQTLIRRVHRCASSSPALSS